MLRPLNYYEHETRSNGPAENWDDALLWVQDWVQVTGRCVSLWARKLRRVNERIDGYEPGGRRFEKL